MTVGLLDQEIRKGVFDAMQSGKPPFATYRKTILGMVAVRYLDPIRMTQEEIILRGDPNNPDELETQIIRIWSPAEDLYLRRNNKSHLEQGILIPYSVEEELKESVNQISDEEIELILQKPFFALKNKLGEFTSTVPVRRFLHMAEQMNRPVGTINYIKQVLESMESN